jgi:hypothetical protein
LKRSSRGSCSVSSRSSSRRSSATDRMAEAPRLQRRASPAAQGTHGAAIAPLLQPREGASVATSHSIGPSEPTVAALPARLAWLPRNPWERLWTRLNYPRGGASKLGLQFQAVSRPITSTFT